MTAAPKKFRLKTGTKVFQALTTKLGNCLIRLVKEGDRVPVARTDFKSPTLCSTALRPCVLRAFPHPFRPCNGAKLAQSFGGLSLVACLLLIGCDFQTSFYHGPADSAERARCEAIDKQFTAAFSGHGIRTLWNGQSCMFRDNSGAWSEVDLATMTLKKAGGAQ